MKKLSYPHDINIMVKMPYEECWEASFLVFKTLRIGFPNAHVNVYIDKGVDIQKYKEHMPFGDLGVDFITNDIANLNHYQWIESLLKKSQKPFIVLDTDIVFHESVEGFKYAADEPLSGRYIPAYANEAANAFEMSRLHTAFLYLNPQVINKRLAFYHESLPQSEFFKTANPVHSLLIPSVAGGIFYDTCSILYGMVNGKPFNEKQLDCYDHLQSGTLMPLIESRLSDIKLRDAHKAILADLKLIKGQWRAQQEYYERHAMGVNTKK